MIASGPLSHYKVRQRGLCFIPGGGKMFYLKSGLAFLLVTLCVCTSSLAFENKIYYSSPDNPIIYVSYSFTVDCQNQHIRDLFISPLAKELTDKVAFPAEPDNADVSLRFIINVLKLKDGSTIGYAVSEFWSIPFNTKKFEKVYSCQHAPESTVNIFTYHDLNILISEEELVQHAAETAQAVEDTYFSSIRAARYNGPFEKGNWPKD